MFEKGCRGSGVSAFEALEFEVFVAFGFVAVL